VEQHPIKGLGIVLTLGLLIGGVLRQVAPPARVLHRQQPARPPTLAEPLAPRAVQVSAKKPSLVGGLVGTWKTKARRSLLRELLMAGAAQLLATGFVRKRVAASQSSWTKRFVLAVLDRAFPRRRFSR
jgi:hypothetical protein